MHVLMRPRTWLVLAAFVYYQAKRLAWRLVLLIPLLHLLFHVLGIPHPEALTFIP
jgi:hypothetical protein